VNVRVTCKQKVMELPFAAGWTRRPNRLFDRTRISAMRFYSPLAPPELTPADQRVRGSMRVCGVPPSAMRPWVSRPPGAGLPPPSGG
jgi:hypothetical protein